MHMKNKDICAFNEASILTIILVIELNHWASQSNDEYDDKVFCFQSIFFLLFRGVWLLFSRIFQQIVGFLRFYLLLVVIVCCDVPMFVLLSVRFCFIVFVLYASVQRFLIRPFQVCWFKISSAHSIYFVNFPQILALRKIVNIMGEHRPAEKKRKRRNKTNLHVMSISMNCIFYTQQNLRKAAEYVNVYVKNTNIIQISSKSVWVRWVEMDKNVKVCSVGQIQFTNKKSLKSKFLWPMVDREVSKKELLIDFILLSQRSLLKALISTSIRCRRET